VHIVRHVLQILHVRPYHHVSQRYEVAVLQVLDCVKKRRELGRENRKIRESSISWLSGCRGRYSFYTERTFNGWTTFQREILLSDRLNLIGIEQRSTIVCSNAKCWEYKYHVLIIGVRKFKLILSRFRDLSWSINILSRAPSAIPHGYFLPRTFLPSCSTTVFAPTTANGTRSLNNLWNLLSSSSSISGNS